MSKGTGMAFMTGGQCEVRVGKIQVTEWDGHFEADASRRAGY